jgi:hypothetical protein
MATTNEPITLVTSEPLDKVRYGAYAAALAPILVALIKRYALPDLTPDIELAINILAFGIVSGVASLAAGYLTKIKASEAKAINQAAAQQDVGVKP